MSLLRRHLILTAGFIAGLSAQTYTFTKIAESDTTYAYHYRLFLTDNGTVAFTESRVVPKAPPAPPTSFQYSAFVVEGGKRRQLGNPALSCEILNVSRNGRVLFVQRDDDGKAKLFVDYQDSVSEIESTANSRFASFSSASINDGGDVIFRAFTDEGVAGIYLKDASGEVSTVAEHGDFVASSQPPAINNRRDIAFQAHWATSAIFWRTEDQFIDLAADFKVSATPGIGAIPFDGPILNQQGTAVFTQNGFPQGVLLRRKRNGPLETLLRGRLAAAAINDQGTVAFLQQAINTLAGFLYGAYILPEGATVPLKVIESGDQLFGERVTRVGNSFVDWPSGYLNNQGHVAFFYQLASGKTGIAVATPR